MLWGLLLLSSGTYAQVIAEIKPIKKGFKVFEVTSQALLTHQLSNNLKIHTLALQGVQPPAISYITPQSLVINNSFTPLTPVNAGGTIPATIYGQVSTYTNGAPSNFVNLTGVTTDPNGVVYAADWVVCRVIKINQNFSGSVLAGSGNPGSADGQGIAASFNEPDGLISDNAGNIYVGDQANGLIRKITPAGLVTTLAGSPGAVFNNPRGLAVDTKGNIYVADQGNNEIKKVTPAGIVTIVAGTGTPGFSNNIIGTSAMLNTPTGVGIDLAGNLYVADAGNNAIRKISPAGSVTTFATGLSFPREVRVDGTGNCYVTDHDSNSIKRISPSGVVTTLAGTGQAGATNGNGNIATFNAPIGLALDGRGNLFVAENGNSLVRKILISGYTIDKKLPPGLTFDPTTGIISGIPTALSQSTEYTITAYNGGGSSTTILNLAVITLKPSVITFPPQVNNNIGSNAVLYPGATSTNNETPITYTSSNPSVAYVGTDGLVHVIAPGVTVITANQAGDANFTPAAAVSDTFTITEGQNLLLPVIADKTTCDPDFNVGALSSNPLLPIFYNSSDPAIATVSAQGEIHLVSAGSTVITISQPGNQLYIPAVPQSQTLSVTLPVMPVVTITPDISTICQGMPVIFTASVKNAANISYQWRLNGVNTGSNSAVYTLTSPSSSDAIQCLVTNNSSCQAIGASNTYTGIIINSYITPSVSISSSQMAPVCSGTPITFSAVVSNGGTAPSYQWQVNGINAGANNSVFKGSSFSNGDIITCVLTNTSSPCLTVSEVTSAAIEVNIMKEAEPKPSVTITASLNNVYTGSLISFTAFPLNADTIINYQWQVNGMNVGINSNVYSSSSLMNLDAVTCIVVSSVACSIPTASPPVIMHLIPSVNISIPNAFTPNGDGINDKWDIPGLLNFPDCSVKIFDRYGRLLYNSKGYYNSWNGYYNGQQLPFSTYYYIIELGGIQTQKLSGYVALIK